MSFLPPACPKARPRRQRAISDAVDTFLYHTADPALSVRYLLAQVPPDMPGVYWYYDAYDVANNVCPSDTIRGAGILAALSPQTSWSLNQELAFALVRDPDTNPGTITNFYEKARNIYYGAQPAAVLRGRKVRSFFHNIAYPDSSYHVTVDRHMIDAMTRARGFASMKEAKVLERPGVYTYAAGVLRSVARDTPHPYETRSLLPSELQAVLWVEWRNRHAVNF